METLQKILQIPDRCLARKKISKAFFKRNFDLTNAEKSLLEDASAIVSIDWVASISLSTANIPPYKDEKQLFEEVQIILVETAGDPLDKKQHRIADLIQKYIPYPVLMGIRQDGWVVWNACDKSINQNDSSRRVIDKKYDSPLMQYTLANDLQRQFYKGMAFASLDKTNLKSYYESYIQAIVSLQVAGVSGVYVARTREQTQQDQEVLEKIEILQKEILILQNQAKSESQLNQQVALNTQIHEKKSQMEQLKALITA